MGTTLDNGIYLPDEGERNCYDGLAGNWVALDNHLGSTNIHVTINDKQAWNGHIADTTIHVTSADKQAWNGHIADSVKHVTAEDKQAWNGKADASALTAHTGDTTIHVTAEDKAKWDAVTSKADNSDVVHKSGNETVGGIKTFSSDLIIANTDTTANTPNLSLRNYKADRGTTETAVQTISFSDKNSKALSLIESRRTSNGNTGTNILCYNTDDSNNTVSGGVTIIKSKTYTNFAPNVDNAVTCGRALAKWSDVVTYKVNGLNPSSLSLPDINNRIDISSYITNLSNVGNEYTPSVNGWICIRSGNATKISVLDVATSIGNASISNTATYLTVMTPVIANRKVYISVICTSLEHAYFIPCQGNV